MLDSGFIRILIEKPGALISEQLEALIKKAESKGITMYINYQRSFDERLSKLYLKVAELI
jgi:predicted dehydrogenase